MVFLLSDLEVPIRGRTYREPEGGHVALVRGRHLEAALEHLGSRADCRALGVIGLPELPPEPASALEVLAGRRLLLCGSDRLALRRFAEAGLRVGADVEWIHDDHPELDRVAAWCLPVGAVVLAAGAASRMGTNKLLLEAGGEPLVRHVIAAAAEGGCHAVHAVYSEDAVREAIGRAATCVYNPDAVEGQSTSLAAGLRSLPAEMAGALVMLGDQPLVGARTVALLLKAWRRENARPAAAAAYGDQGWLPPVLLERSLWPDLLALTGDEGARRLFKSRPELLDTVPVAGRPDDVDTPDDYDRIVRLFPRPRPGRTGRRGRPGRDG